MTRDTRVSGGPVGPRLRSQMTRDTKVSGGPVGTEAEVTDDQRH